MIRQLREVFRQILSVMSPWTSSGFLQSAIAGVAGCIAVLGRWPSFAMGPFDALLFSDSATGRVFLWMGARERHIRILALIICLAMLAELVRRSFLRRKDSSAPALGQALPGAVAGTLAFFGAFQFETARYYFLARDRPFSSLLTDHARLLLFWGAAWLVLLSSGRALLGRRSGLRRLAVVSGTPIILGLVLLAPTARFLVDSEDWRHARAVGTVLAYDEYLRAWPHSRHRPEALRRAWRTVVSHPDPVHVDCYLRYAAAWGDRLDSARVLRAVWFSRLQQAVHSASFAGDANIDKFWRERLPDADRPYSGSRIVRYRVLLEPLDTIACVRDLRRRGGGRIAPHPQDIAALDGRDVEHALDAVVHSWAGPALITIAPEKDDASGAALEIHIRPRFVPTWEPVPCDPGCPSENERIFLPALAFDWEAKLTLLSGNVVRTFGTALDTVFSDEVSDSSEDEARDRIPEAWKNLDLEQAWQRRRDRSLAHLAESFARSWRLSAFIQKVAQNREGKIVN